MNRFRILNLSAIVTLALMVLPDGAFSQQAPLKDQLIGTWALVSNDNVAPDGTRRQLFGANPKGIMVLAANGQFAQIMVRPDVPKFKSNNRLKGTSEETHRSYTELPRNSVPGRSDEASKTLITLNEGAMFPNQAGTVSNALPR